MARRFALLLFAAANLLLAGCREEKQSKAPEVRPVRAVVATPEDSTETLTFTGHIAADDEAAFAFRLGGRLTERPVNVGDRVQVNQMLGRLDAQDEVNRLRSAQAALATAQARLQTARATFDRQRQLLAAGHTPRAQYDIALEELRTADASLDHAEAEAANQALRISWTMLQADSPGIVSAVGAETGEVVAAGQMIVRIARANGRDAVFDVPGRLIQGTAANALVAVQLADDPTVVAQGRVRETAAQADPVTRSFEVKVGIIDPPEAMRLGSIVTGSIRVDGQPAISLPASALTSIGGEPAVWTVDPEKQTVSLRKIQVARFDESSVIVSGGIETGDLVVTAGVQSLHPGQKVRLLERTS